MKCYYVCKNIGLDDPSNVEYRYRVVSIDARIYEFLIDIHCSDLDMDCTVQSAIGHEFIGTLNNLDLKITDILIILFEYVEVFRAWYSYRGHWEFGNWRAMTRGRGVWSIVVLIRWSPRILWVMNWQAAAMPNYPTSKI